MKTRVSLNQIFFLFNQDLDKSGCGDVLFYSYLAPPSVPPHEQTPASKPNSASRVGGGHSRGASVDLRRSHSRTNSADLRGPQRPDRPPPPVPGHATHSRNSSADLNKSFRNEVGLLFGVQAGAGALPWVDPLRVLLVTAHHSCLAVAYKHFVAVYRYQESNNIEARYI